jgi:hypothetical protein
LRAQSCAEHPTVAGTAGTRLIHRRTWPGFMATRGSSAHSDLYVVENKGEDIHGSPQKHLIAVRIGMC